MAFALERLESIVSRRANEYGNKARSLAQLSRAGFPVPTAYAISADVCEQFLRSNLSIADLPGALMISGGASEEHLQSIAAQVRAAPLKWEVENAIRVALEQLRAEGSQSFAVRSSAAHEDEIEYSAAGLHRSYLNIQDDEAVIAAVKQCWATLFQPALLAYLESRDRFVSAGIGVIIQSMIDAEVSGVMMTCNPLTGDASQIIIATNYGLATTVVGGDTPVDHVRVDKHSGQVIDQIIAKKTLYDALSTERGVERRAVQDQHQTEPCLHANHLELLRRLAQRLEHQFQGPQDVEWAVADGALYVLQSRAMQTVTRLYSDVRRDSSAPSPGDLVWSRANVGEALPGAATPLSWSVMSRFSELGFRRLFGAFGCHVPSNLRFVGEFRGRIYLNLTAILEVLNQLPQIDPTLLTALGGGVDTSAVTPAPIEKKPGLKKLHVPGMLWRAGRTNWALYRELSAFEDVYAKERNRIASNDLRVLSPDGLYCVLKDTERLLDLTGATMLTVYGRLLIALMVLRTTAERSNLPDPAAVTRDLLSALTHGQGAEMIQQMSAIAAQLTDDEQAAAFIRRGKSVRHLEDFPAGPVRNALGDFLRRYGHRAAREAEIAQPRWSEDISTLILSISLLSKKNLDVNNIDALAQESLERRQQAEKQLLSALPLLKRSLIQLVLGEVAEGIRKREIFRGRVVEVLGLYRKIALEIDKRMHDLEPHLAPDAAFYLSVDELMTWLEAPSEQITARVQERKKQHERYTAMPDPPPTFVNRPSEPVLVGTPDADVLQGMGVCAGSVEGRARVISSAANAHKLSPQEILVTSVVDVGWAPIFAGCRGVISELGGPLSHAAIILRELGIPAVFNLAQATEIFRTGDLLRLDGSTGRVQRLKRAN